MKIRVRDEPLTCDICKGQFEAVVDAPGRNGAPWGYFCQDCVDAFAIAHWRTSTITTMIVRHRMHIFN